MQVLQPASTCSRLFQVKRTGANDFRNINSPVICTYDFCSAIERLDEALDLGQCLLIILEHVCFVQDNDIRKFDLVNHKMRNRALVLGDDIIASIGQEV